MQLIEHDPEEPPRDRTGYAVYWANFALLALFWTGTLMLDILNWGTVALGVWTGAFIAIWSIDITGNKVPKWMR